MLENTLFFLFFPLEKDADDDLNDDMDEKRLVDIIKIEGGVYVDKITNSNKIICLTNNNAPETNTNSIKVRCL